MTENSNVTKFQSTEPHVAYIGEGVCFKGAISVPDIIVVDGVVEGDITARAVRVGPSGSIKGVITSTEADVYGVVMEKVEVKQLLIVRSSGRIEGTVSYGEVQVEKGAVIAGGFESTDVRSDRPSIDRTQIKMERLRLTFGDSSDDREQIPVRTNGALKDVSARSEEVFPPSN